MRKLACFLNTNLFSRMEWDFRMFNRWHWSEGYCAEAETLCGLKFLPVPKERTASLPCQFPRYGTERQRGGVELESCQQSNSKMEADPL